MKACPNVLAARSRIEELSTSNQFFYNPNETRSVNILSSTLANISYNTLDQFDMVYSLPQSTINNQIKLLSALGSLPTEWKSTKNGSSIDATFGCPSVDFNTGDAMNNKAHLALPIPEGTMTISSIGEDKDGNPVIVKKDHQLNGAVLKITTNVSIADVANTYKDDAKIPKEVKDQLSKFSNEMFNINQLFLNFEDVNLLTGFSLDGIPGIDMSDNNVVTAINTLVEAYINGLKGSDNPYIAGYSVTDKSANQGDSTWDITGVTYNIYPDPTSSPKSTLNYLLITDQQKVPTGNVGIFNHNWVTDPSEQGVFVISQKLVMAFVLAEVAKIMGITANDFTKHNEITFMATTGNSEGGSTTCTLTSVTNTNTVTAGFHNTFRKDAHDGLGSYIGYVDGYVDFMTTISFGIDSKTGKVSVTTSNSKPTQVVNDHPNFLGSLEKVFADIADAIIAVFTFGQVTNVFNQMINNDWNVAIGTPFSADFAAMKSRIILPAGGEILFRDVSFYNEGSMLLTTTINN